MTRHTRHLYESGLKMDINRRFFNGVPRVSHFQNFFYGVYILLCLFFMFFYEKYRE